MENKNKIYSMFFSIIATAIIGFVTIFIISKTIKKDSNTPNTPVDTTINMIDSVQIHKQTDSIKYLNETILEIKKELDELKQQKPDPPKPAAISTNNVSKTPDTTRVQQLQKEAAADSANNAKPDTSAVKAKPETENDTINN